MGCDRSLFMGDIIIDTDTTCSIETASGTSSIVITKGSWFADAFLFWGYIQQEHEDQTGDSLDGVISIGDAVGDPPILNVYITFGTAILSDSIDNAALATIVGWGDITGDGYTEGIEYTFMSRFPTHTYNKTSRIEDSDTCVAESGSIQSSIGTRITEVELGISISGTVGVTWIGDPYYQERFFWFSLWNSHWRKGRSVTCYLNYEDMQGMALTNTYPYVINGDILVLPSTTNLVRSSRLVPASDQIHKTDSYRFYVRQPYPLTAKSTQGSRLL